MPDFNGVPKLDKRGIMRLRKTVQGTQNLSFPSFQLYDARPDEVREDIKPYNFFDFVGFPNPIEQAELWPIIQNFTVSSRVTRVTSPGLLSLAGRESHIVHANNYYDLMQVGDKITLEIYRADIQSQRVATIDLIVGLPTKKENDEVLLYSFPVLIASGSVVGMSDLLTVGYPFDWVGVGENNFHDWYYVMQLFPSGSEEIEDINFWLDMLDEQQGEISAGPTSDQTVTIRNRTYACRYHPRVDVDSTLIDDGIIWAISSVVTYNRKKYMTFDCKELI